MSMDVESKRQGVQAEISPSLPDRIKYVITIWKALVERSASARIKKPASKTEDICHTTRIQYPPYQPIFDIQLLYEISSKTR